MAVIDRQLALCASANLDRRSLFLNYEAMTAFYSADQTNWLGQWVVDLAKEARPYVKKSPNWARDLLEGMVRTVGFQL